MIYIFQPLQSNGNKHKQCINRVFCQTTSKTINFKIPTSIFQTDKQKTQLLTNWKCKKYLGHKWMGQLCAIEWVRIVCCVWSYCVPWVLGVSQKCFQKGSEILVWQVSQSKGVRQSESECQNTTLHRFRKCKYISWKLTGAFPEAYMAFVAKQSFLGVGSMQQWAGSLFLEIKCSPVSSPVSG